MAVPQQPAADGELSPTPDEDGPHDVPDDTVIEKTLPTAPVSDAGTGGATPSRDKPQA
jgi:hypothetical protein